MVKNGRRKLTRVSVREKTTEYVQRWFCFRCRQSITFRKEETRQHFSDVFIFEAVKDFIQGRSSYAVIKERKGISVGTLSSWVHKFGNACMNPAEVAVFLGLKSHNRWGGILLLDGKYIRKNCLLLLAVDYQTLDIVAWIVVEAETEKNYIALVNLVEQCGYVIKALISDGHPAITALTTPKKPEYIIKGTRRYPRPGIVPAKPKRARLEGTPHQWCVVHAERELKQMVTKEGKRTGEKYETLLSASRSIPFAKTLHKATRLKEKLIGDSFGKDYTYQRVTRWITTHWEFLITHHALRVNKRKIPRDSNTVENVIAYINTRLKTMRKLRTKQSAIPITNLIVVNYRTKPLQNTKNKLKRGKSPLALSTGLNRRFDWMDFIKKSTA